MKTFYMILYLGHDEDLIRFWWHCFNFEGHESPFWRAWRGSILTGKRNATVYFLSFLHVARKHELKKPTITRILNQASRLFQFVDFVYLVHLYVG